MNLNGRMLDLANAGGTLAPGDSPGVTQVHGDYTQGSAPSRGSPIDIRIHERQRNLMPQSQNSADWFES